MTIKIEKGIPIPEVYERRGKWSRVFIDMEVGDSFVVTKEMMTGHKTSQSAKASVHHAAKAIGVKIAIRSREAPKDGYGEFRVWLTSKGEAR
tara:strand:+ start:407 stop:682 length:276 start_codon:yes stop_codon:yes gene_type:complete